MREDRDASAPQSKVVLVTLVLLSLIPFLGGHQAVSAQVGALPLPPITIPDVTVPTLPPVTPNQSTTTSSTTTSTTMATTTTTAKPNCEEFTMTPKQPQWGQVVTLTPKGSFGSERGSATVVGVPSGAKDYSKSAALPLQDGTWRADSLKVVLPSKPPADQLDEWTLEVASGQVKCALNVPVVRILDCENLVWSVQKAWKLKPTVHHLDGTTFVPADRVVPLPLPMGPADKVALDFTRALGVPSSLTDVLDKVGGGIRFGISRGGSAPEEFHVTGGQFGFASTPGPPDSQAANVTVLPRPMVVPAENNQAYVANGQYKTLNRSLKLLADIVLPTEYCVGKQLQGLEILSIPLEQRPVVLPAIGVFFEHPDFKGDALAVVDVNPDAPMPPGMNLPAAGAWFDGASDADVLKNQKAAISLAFQLLSQQASVLQPAFPSGIPSGGPTGALAPLPVAGNLSLVAGQMMAAEHPAIVAGKRTYELSEIVRAPCCWSSFNKVISSVATVGLPGHNHFTGWRCDWLFGCTWVSRDFSTNGELLNLVSDVGSEWDNRPERIAVG